MFGYIKEKIVFFDKFSSMLNAGIRVDRIISFCKESVGSKRFLTVLSDIETKTVSGQPMSEAMKRFPDVFTTVDIAVASSGDQNGRIDQSFQMLSEYYKQKLYVRNTIIAKLAYPVFLIHAACIIPTLPTLILGSAVSYFLTVISSLFPLYAGSLFLYIAHMKLRTSDIYGAILLKIPVIGGIVQKQEYARFCEILSIALNSGVTVDKSLNIAIKAVQNACVSKVLQNAAIHVSRGSDLTTAFSSELAIPKIVNEFIETGEMSGTLPESLHKASELFNTEALNSTEIVLKVLPVIVFLAVGLYIATTIIGFYMGRFTF